MPAYEHLHDVGLHHCDPSGIVFLPRYYEMIHEVIENWFEEALDWPMGQLHGANRLSLPLVSVDTHFPAPSRLGDRLRWRLTVREVGRTSMKLRLTALCAGDERVRCSATLILSEQGAMQPRRWPDRVRALAEDYFSPADLVRS